MKYPFAFLAQQSSGKDAIVLPVLYDRTQSFLSGSKDFPIFVIRASWELPDFDAETEVDFSKVSLKTEDFLIFDIQPEKMVAELREFIPAGFFVMIGGEHSISAAIPFEGIGILHIDAHPDLMDFYQGSRYSHACVMRRLAEKGNKIASVGITLAEREEKLFAEEKGILWTDSFKEALKFLPDKIYISIDLDAILGLKVATPAGGKLTLSEVIAGLKLAFKEKDVVGMDVVEGLPEWNTAFTAAFLIQKAIAYKIRYKVEKV